MKKYLLIILLICLNTALFSGEYKAKFKYYELQDKLYDRDDYQQVSAVNFGFIGAYANDEYIIRFEKKPYKLSKRLLDKMIKNQQKVDKAKRDLRKLKFNKELTEEEKELNKRIYINTINYFGGKVKDEGLALQNIYNAPIVYGVKHTGYIKRIYAKRGDLIKKGFRLFQYLNEKKARMKIKLNEEDYKYIENKKIRKNNVYVPKEQYSVKEDEKTGEKYLFIYLENPSDYEMNQQYNISIE